jgi:general secretion pathway protein H
VQPISKARRNSARRAGSAAASSQSGIILLDIVIAMAVLGLLVFLVMPTLPRHTTASRLEGYAAEVAAMLKTDRSAAARSGREVATRVDIAARRIVSGASGRAIALPADVTLDLIASDSCRTPAGQFAVVFAADGRSCGAVVSLAKDGRTWRIRINWLTGFIDVVAPERS